MKSMVIRYLLAIGLFGSGMAIGVLIGSLATGVLRITASSPTHIWDVALPIPQDWLVREERLSDAILRDYYFGTNPFPVLSIGRFYLDRSHRAAGLKQAISTYHQKPFECLGQQAVDLDGLKGTLCQFRHYLPREPKPRRGEALIVSLPDGLVWIHWSVWEHEYSEARSHYRNLLRKLRVRYLYRLPKNSTLDFFISGLEQ